MPLTKAALHSDWAVLRHAFLALALTVLLVSPGAALAQESLPQPGAAEETTPLVVPGLGDGMGILHLEEGVPAADPGVLPHDLSPWGMFMAADLVVKAVMVGLAFASVVTWTICLAKFLELAVVRRRAREGAARLARAGSLALARRDLGKRDLVAGSLVGAAETELDLSGEDLAFAEGGKAGIKERVASRLDRIEAAAGRRMIRGTGVLATIGSTAPFVGLFGTVWGIMNSFIGISEAQTTNLAVVAPGIAEALLATAIGLVAAIPAVVVYNHFARQIAGCRALVADMAAEVMRLVSRDLDRLGAVRSGFARAAE
ncbi:tonB-system energizer ExbB [Geminicoccus roseus]|uniref:tonB-system energizer ExbB n=1 Tax=Geminicoccus roseus TaxID=404900 RepID=UPI000418D49F|nr:tonB-system energizer ExbB [Geminicoccus roseus]